jgi:hypothetical protein
MGFLAVFILTEAVSRVYVKRLCRCSSLFIDDELPEEKQQAIAMVCDGYHQTQDTMNRI